MIIEIALVTGVVAAAGALTAALRRRKRPPRATARNGANRGLRVGDVLLHQNSEVWLAGSVTLDEDGFALALFRCPGNPFAEWVAITDRTAKEIFFLKTNTALGDGGPADTIRVGELELRIARRGQATLALDGEELPQLGLRARYTVWRGISGQLALALDTDTNARLALAGERIDGSMLDLLPGGDIPRDV